MTPTEAAGTTTPTSTIGAQTDIDRFVIGGQAPRRTVRVTTAEEAAAALAAARAAGEAVVPWGAGTQQRLGNSPRRYDVALDLTALNAVLEYEPDDLVVTAQAGVPLSALQARLGERGQFLPLDPPNGDRATLGGVLAANASGPSRFFYGTARDLVLGLRVATPDGPNGELVRSGGRVVKNVVGYDLNKLHIGALGTAGVIVEVTFKVQPLPPAEATVVASFASLDTAHAVAGQIARSFLYPRALDLVRDAASNGTWRLLAWCAGAGAAVERQARDIAQWCLDGGAIQVERLEGDAHPAAWQHVASLGREQRDGSALLKLAALPAQLAALIAQADARSASRGPVTVVARAGNGVAYCRLPGADAALVRQVAAAAHELGGTAVLEDAPDAVKTDLDAWDPAGLAARTRDDYALMRAIKAQFDPDNTLNPGRFVAGI